MKNGDQPPSGVMMMLKALGIQIDPAMFKTMAEAVVEIRDRLRRIEEKVNKLAGEENPSPSVVPVKTFAPADVIAHGFEVNSKKGETDNAADRNGKEVAGRTQG